MSSRLRTPGTAAAAAHSAQEISTPCCAASSTTSGFAAIAVRNIALVTTTPWYTVNVRNAAIRRSVPLSAALSSDTQSDLRIGYMTPPARAVLLGMAGASTRSAATRPYASPRLRRPSTRMKWYAMRVPSPVLTKAVAMKKAATTSQTTVLPKPAVASAIVSVPESTATATAISATAPIGSGRRTMPTMVATKMASNCQARGSTPAGSGTSQIATPTAQTAARRAVSTRARRPSGFSVAVGHALPPLRTDSSSPGESRGAKGSQPAAAGGLGRSPI